MSKSVTPNLPTTCDDRNPVHVLVQSRCLSMVLLTALRKLSDEHRQVLLECYLRGASVADAAQTLGVPPGTIKSRSHYALHALRQAIDEMGGVA
jgi:RNA polymerase sigma-70 factor (ECF subfamily)